MKEIIGDYEAFISGVDAGLIAVGIDRSELAMMDHICYRVETLESYNERLQAFSTIATLLGETTVAGRIIATFELHNYIQVARWTVPYLELPAPKEGSPYPEGLEHAELVVVGSLQRFKEKHPDLPLDSKSMSKGINPELGLKMNLATGSLSVKFHELQLGAVVRIEQVIDRT